MVSKELLRDYFQGILNTNILSYSEFSNMVSDYDNSIDPNLVREWYAILLQNDENISIKIKEELENVLNILNEMDIDTLTEKYKQNYFSLETFINNLYNTGMILNNKILSINSEIEDLTNKLKDFQEQLGNLRNSSENFHEVNKIVAHLKHVQKIIEQLTDFRSL